MNDTRPNVALFVTCLVDLFRPSVGFAAARLIESAGYTVYVANSARPTQVAPGGFLSSTSQLVSVTQVVRV